MPPTRTRPSEEEREQRRAAERELTEQAVEQLRTSAGWQRWLTVRRHFRSYSLGNQLLISLQAAHATHVAGFRAWLNLGYAVNRGEHGLRIWMPLPPSNTRVDAWRKAGADPADKPRLLFKLGTVFDRAQVSPRPSPANPATLDPPISRLEADELARLHAPLQQFAKTIGYSVRIEPLNGPEGVCNIASRRSRSRQTSNRTARSRPSCPGGGGVFEVPEWGVRWTGADGGCVWWVRTIGRQGARSAPTLAVPAARAVVCGLFSWS